MAYIVVTSPGWYSGFATVEHVVADEREALQIASRSHSVVYCASGYSAGEKVSPAAIQGMVPIRQQQPQEERSVIDRLRPFC